MMERNDMIDLIKAYESIENLSAVITGLTGGYPIDDDKYNGIYKIYDILKRNSRYPGADDFDEDNFQAIINAINKTPEEKYNLLKIRNNGYDSDTETY